MTVHVIIYFISDSPISVFQSLSVSLLLVGVCLDIIFFLIEKGYVFELDYMYIKHYVEGPTLLAFGVTISIPKDIIGKTTWNLNNSKVITWA